MNISKILSLSLILIAPVAGLQAAAQEVDTCVRIANETDIPLLLTFAVKDRAAAKTAREAGSVETKAVMKRNGKSKTKHLDTYKHEFILHPHACYQVNPQEFHQNCTILLNAQDRKDGRDLGVYALHPTVVKITIADLYDPKKMVNSFETTLPTSEVVRSDKGLAHVKTASEGKHNKSADQRLHGVYTVTMNEEGFIIVSR